MNKLDLLYRGDWFLQQQGGAPIGLLLPWKNYGGLLQMATAIAK